QADLELMRIPYEVNPRIVRGLDYYTNTAFEIVADGLGAQNSLAGGGRYNGLIEQFGGKSIPAIGFAGGFERLLLALEEEKVDLGPAPRPDAWLIVMGEEARRLALPYLNALRVAGINTGFDPDKASFKAQLKAADNSQARFALIVGEDEVSSQTIVLKNLQTGAQQSLPLEPFAAVIAALTS
ncbi:MAG: ATP phosphoribosyltransferase regulatory subunit, partial [Candidatus Syntrophosphaera sp.]|nr:ATP phosphoribosyltransferase regulatory subunit [Candidatus Syntrophosphaera sp.]